MKKRTDEGEALTGLILETFRLNGAMLEAGNRITRPHGLTSARWQVMGAIDLAGEALTVAQISTSRTYAIDLVDFSNNLKK